MPPQLGSFRGQRGLVGSEVAVGHRNANRSTYMDLESGGYGDVHEPGFGSGALPMSAAPE